MPEYKHWVNRQDPERLMFVTTTCLNFAKLLQREEMRDRLCCRLARDIQFYGAKLHAFCVMPHHLHLIVQAPGSNSMSWLMQRFKSNSAKDLLPLLTKAELESMGEEYGVQDRKFWMVSFRGIPLYTEEAFWRSVTYVHLNPVRGGLCERIEDYRWSSGGMFEDCLWSSEEGINTAIWEVFGK